MGSGSSKSNRNNQVAQPRKQKRPDSSDDDSGADDSDDDSRPRTPVMERSAVECEAIEELKAENQEAGWPMWELANKETYGYDETEVVTYIVYLIKSDDLVVFVERNSGGSYSTSCNAVMDILLSRTPKLIDVTTIDKYPPSAILTGLSKLTDSTKLPQTFYKGEFFGFARIIQEWHKEGSLDEQFQNADSRVADSDDDDNDDDDENDTE